MWSAMVSLGVVLVVSSACGGERAAQPVSPKATAPACIADGLGPLRTVTVFDAACRDEQRSCKQDCAGGDASACMQHAYVLQQAEADEADQMFGRACQLGLAVGCTNHGAGLWLANQPPTPANTACARRLFDRACEVREQFGCGMAGRMLAHEAHTPAEIETARRFFDKTCTDLGAMSCRMYAHHLELGQLGPFEPATVKALMLRACDTGDDDACGHETARETFH